ncbi:MAG: helix-turn-helix domain-containing protein [Phormidesmis sp.]
MAPRKLSDSDKNEIIDLYRQPGQTTSTLAEQYGVSNSTISRILKGAIPSEEYSALIAEKRMSGSDKPRRTQKKAASKPPAKEEVVNESLTVPEFAPAANQPDIDGTLVSEKPKKASAPKRKPSKKKVQSTAAEAEETKTEAASDEQPTTSRRRRRRSRAKDEETGQLPLLAEESAESEELAERAAETEKPVPAPRPKPVLVRQDEDDDDIDEDDDAVDLQGLDETLGDDFGDDDDLDEDEDDDEDDSDVELSMPRASAAAALSIMPLDEAVLPKPCYLVVDMRAELITRPLVEFSDLGQIPSSEEREKTLPVFDNHRVARRFSRNKQRVIKVPDGSLITRTSPYLTAKGITRLLVDGQVFDLAGIE